MPDPPLSPYRLIAEAEQASEVVILSFTAGLEFFERFALGAARATQARVTVIADATAVSADPAAVRNAGRTYLDARAACPGGRAFHPKLLVIAGSGGATAAIGSGNLTLAGWHHNAELWAGLHATVERGPRAIMQIAAFLRALPAAGIQLSQGAGAALSRTADLLDALAPTAPGPLLVSSLERPIVEQLPTGPVDELLLYAPFFDAELAALERLVERFEPRRLTVCVQPTLTVVDGERLTALLARRGGVAMEVLEDRYHHGKLVEWCVDGRRFALTGSPNLSRSALLRAVGDGGNCELGLVTELPASLVPPLGAPLPAAQLRAVTYRPSPRSQPGIVLLGAALSAGGLHLQLRDPLPTAGRLQVFDAGVWSDRMAVPAGQADTTLAGEAAWVAGTAVRVRADSGAASNEVFVADLGRVLRALRPHVGRALAGVGELFEDPTLLERFLADAQLLRPHLLLRGSGGGAGESSERPAPSEPPRPLSIEQYLDACTSVLGEQMLHFALGLPTLPALGAAAGHEASDGFEPPDEEGSDGAAPLGVPSFVALGERHRRRLQRWCARLAELAPSLVLVGRVLTVRLIARAAAGRLWVEREEWTPLLGRALDSLAAPGQAYPEERVAAASMGAVGLAILHSQIRRFSQSDPVGPVFARSAATLAPLLDARDEARVEEYGEELTGAFGSAVGPEGVALLLDELAHPPDPLDRAVRLLADEYDLAAHRRGSVLVYDTELVGDPVRALLLAIGVAEPAAPVAAVGHAERGQVLAVWQPPLLSVLRRGPNGVWGTVHRIARDLSPRLHAVTRTELPVPERRWTVKEEPPPDVAQALAAVGLEPRAPF